MDQIKIGKFIAATRKELSLTQAQLAERLGISDKTVSKWETGKGLPEVSLMLPLCEVLCINVNELLSCQRLADADYKKNAEDNFMTLIREREDSKRKIILSVLVFVFTFIPALTVIILAGYLSMAIWLRAVLIVIGLLSIFGGIGIAVALDIKAGTYECPACGERFEPAPGAYVMGVHSITTRYLKCPKCGKKSFCKRRLTH